MPESSLCPQCGRLLRADAPEGLCPECLLIEAMQSVSDGGQEQEGTGSDGVAPAEPPVKPVPRLEDFRLSHHGKFRGSIVS